MGLNVDFVRQGYGTSNDGNTSRRFFQNFEKAAEITGIDQRLIENIYALLQVLAAGEEIDVKKFESHTKLTAKLYVDLYEWYHMPASLHKILIHGASIIKKFQLPISYLSEEATEARNKHFRNKERKSRKSCRKYTNQNILYNLLLTSDPYTGFSFQN